MRRAVAKLIPYPTRPLQEIWIIPRESYETEFVFHQNLLDQVDKRSKAPWIRTVVLFGKDEWTV